MGRKVDRASTTKPLAPTPLKLKVWIRHWTWLLSHYFRTSTWLPWSHGETFALMSRIEGKYCLIIFGRVSWHFHITSCLTEFLGVLVTSYQWGHFVIHIIRNLNLIIVQSWTYLNVWEVLSGYPGFFFFTYKPGCSEEQDHSSQQITQMHLHLKDKAKQQQRNENHNNMNERKGMLHKRLVESDRPYACHKSTCC